MIKVVWKINNKELNLINNPNFKIKISGIDNPTGELISATNPYRPGVQKKRISISKRSITIDFLIISNVEATRQLLYEFFQSGETGELYLSSNYRDGKIQADVIDMPFSRHELPVTAQLFLECPYPYFSDIEDIIREIATSVASFKFQVAFNQKIPFGVIQTAPVIELDNKSDIKIGLVAEMHIYGDMTNPTVANLTTNEYIQVDTSKLSMSLPTGVTATLLRGDVITINTNSGQGIKSMILQRNGIKYNIINTFSRDSVWLQLNKGINRLAISVGGTSSIANIRVYITTTEEYGAI